MTPATPGPAASPKPQYTPGETPERNFSDDELVWTDEEKEQIATYRAQYPTNDGAVMKGLWLAQRKFGWLPPEVMRLVADTLEIPYAKVYGVATFYTMYFKEKKGQFVLDVCTCFSCCNAILLFAATILLAATKGLWSLSITLNFNLSRSPF